MRWFPASLPRCIRALCDASRGRLMASRWPHAASTAPLAFGSEAKAEVPSAAPRAPLSVRIRRVLGLG